VGALGACGGAGNRGRLGRPCRPHTRQQLVGSTHGLIPGNAYDPLPAGVENGLTLGKPEELLRDGAVQLAREPVALLDDVQQAAIASTASLSASVARVAAMG